MSVSRLKLKNNYKEGGNIDIVKFLNKLPFQIHLPNHNYTGPNTNLLLNIEKGIKPYNKIDEASLIHDIDYHENKDLNKRHDADKILQERSKEILNNSSNFKEKMEGLLVSNVMNVKRKMGLGLEKEINIIERFNDFLKKNTDNIKLLNHVKKQEKINIKEYLILFDLCHRKNLKLLYNEDNISYEDEEHRLYIKKIVNKLSINQ